ncbi:MAG: phenylacetate--CoA ligase [Oscillospiraceae bacterium]|jgi:phenylacetate-CoA ligase|nr:phenylacetate--CoA ligase [Oscillospiraceae bacterium]
MNHYWQKEIETMPRRELEALQLERLKGAVARVWNSAPRQRAKLEAAGVRPEDIRTLDDLRRIPFTVKDDFRDNYPFGLFARPMKEIVRLQGSSGTTGKPTMAGYTRADLDTWANLIARLAAAVGVSDEDIAQISFGYGLFTGGFGLHYGLEKLGATVLPLSSGNTERQLMLMEDFGVTVLIATPSYATYLSETVREKGLRDKLRLRVGLFGGEGCTHEMRRRIEDNLGIIATDNYGMCELTGPGISGECLERNGMHFAEDHFLPEIIDPDTGESLPEGSLGELVVTTLTKEALPVLRYRTRDITRLTYEPCRCGRTHARMDKVTGRSDDMLIIKGVNVFPSQIEGVLMRMEHVSPHYLLLVRREGYMDTLEVQVELNDEALLEKFALLEGLQGRIKERLRSVLGLGAKVTLVGPKTIERFQGKAKRVIDLRNNESATTNR